MVSKMIHKTGGWKVAARDPEKTPIRFYRTAAGGEPVLDWMRGLPKNDRRSVGGDLARVQYGWPVGMPLCRSLAGGLWEIRSALPSGRIARIVFFFHGGEIGLLHGFIKKTQKTPAADVALARKRMKEMIL
jgi:phage-related protein